VKVDAGWESRKNGKTRTLARSPGKILFLENKYLFLEKVTLILRVVKFELSFKFKQQLFFFLTKIVST